MHFHRPATALFVGFLILATTARAQTLECREFPDGEPQELSVSDGLLPPAFASALNLDTHGLGSAICGNHLYFVAPTGKFIRAFNYDNGPDYFSADEGLARFVSRDGLIGYVDVNLEIVIPARYEDAFPFRNGKAKVLTIRDGARLWTWIDETGAQVPPDRQ